MATVTTPEAAQGAAKSPVQEGVDIKGRTLWLTQLPFGGSFMLAAAFRSSARNFRNLSRYLFMGGRFT